MAQRLPISLTGALLISLPMLWSCQAPDPKVECAGMASELQAVVNRNPKPPSFDILEEVKFYRGTGNLDFELLPIVNVYAYRLKTPDPVVFCQSLTGESPLPRAVPNPKR